MKTKIKRFISVLLSCTVLVFSCIFVPHQKAEAGLLLAGGVALGTAVAIGLIGYGIAVSSDDPAEDDKAPTDIKTSDATKIETTTPAKEENKPAFSFVKDD